MTATRPTDLDTSDPAPYILAIDVQEVFADHSYQRPLDTKRAQLMADSFDHRLLGVIDVADRGEDATPRYAVIEGQHRLAAVRLRDPRGAIAARIHTGLSRADEAKLFHDIDTQRRRLNTWDRWKARRAHGDAAVAAIDATVARVGLRVDSAPDDGNVRCTSALEKITRSGGHSLLKDSLRLLHDIWGPQQAAYDAALVTGMALFLNAFGDHEQFDCDVLVNSVIDLTPVRIGFIARSKKTNGGHGAGPLAKFVALTYLERYNLHRPAGRRLPTTAALPATLVAAGRSAAAAVSA